MTNFTHKPDNACTYTYSGDGGTIHVNIAVGGVDMTLYWNIQIIGFTDIESET
jgi:hypothetical protein